MKPVLHVLDKDSWLKDLDSFTVGKQISLNLVVQDNLNLENRRPILVPLDNHLTRMERFCLDVWNLLGLGFEPNSLWLVISVLGHTYDVIEPCLKIETLVRYELSI